MGNVTGVLAVLFLGTVTASGLPLIPEKAPPPNNPEASKDYYPAPESAGGWRRRKKDEEVRSLAGMDPQKLDQVGRENIWVDTDGKLWPRVPKDAFAFMGYATNRCYVVPSLDLVVVRLGYGPQPIGPVEIPLVPIAAAIAE